MIVIISWENAQLWHTAWPITWFTAAQQWNSVNSVVPEVLFYFFSLTSTKNLETGACYLAKAFLWCLSIFGQQFGLSLCPRLVPMGGSRDIVVWSEDCFQQLHNQGSRVALVGGQLVQDGGNPASRATGQSSLMDGCRKTCTSVIFQSLSLFRMSSWALIHHCEEYSMTPLTFMDCELPLDFFGFSGCFLFSHNLDASESRIFFFILYFLSFTRDLKDHCNDNENIYIFFWS